jgi:hypothetical protein
MQNHEELSQRTTEKAQRTTEIIKIYNSVKLCVFSV